VLHRLADEVAGRTEDHRTADTGADDPLVVVGAVGVGAGCSAAAAARESTDCRTDERLGSAVRATHRDPSRQDRRNQANAHLTHTPNPSLVHAVRARSMA
jgi:hypothetical protein